MRAEHAARGVVRVRAGIVGGGRDGGRGVAAGVIAVGQEGDLPLPVGERAQGRGVVHQRRDRAAARKPRACAQRFGRAAVRTHGGKVGHHAAHMFRRHGEGKAVVRFQQHAARLHQRLPDGAVHRLPEVAALGVLEVRAAGEQRHPHVAERRARQHAAVLALQNVRADEALVGRGQVVHMAAGVEGDAAAPRAGGKEQVRLGIVPKRLVVAAAHGGRGDGLAVEHVGRQKARVKAEAVLQQPGEHLDLHRAHHPHGGAGVLRVPCHAQGGVLVLQKAQAFHQPRGRRALRRLHAHGQHGLGRRGRGREAVRAQDIAAAGRGQARRAHHVARARLTGGREGRAPVEAQLVNLLRAGGEVKGVARAQRARKHLEKAHALA